MAGQVLNYNLPIYSKTAQSLISNHLGIHSCRPWDEPGGGGIHGTFFSTPPLMIVLPCRMYKSIPDPTVQISALEMFL